MGFESGFGLGQTQVGLFVVALPEKLLLHFSSAAGFLHREAVNISEHKSNRWVDTSEIVKTISC